jgi:quercetin dioxygenase-like cupin family protein
MLVQRLGDNALEWELYGRAGKVDVGEVVMTVDGERSVLRAGDALYAPSGSRHGVANESDLPADVILVFGAPDPASPRLSKE